MWGIGYGWPLALWMMLGGLFWLVVLGLVIWGLVRWLGGRSGSSGQPPVSGPSAQDILRERYARGEIDTATFERMTARLTGVQQPTSVSSDVHDPVLPRD